MKWLSWILLSITCVAFRAWADAGVPTDSTIWTDAPAKNFSEALPLGNGRLGAMLFGGVDDERFILNESSMWSGSVQDADRPGAAEALPEIRRLLLEGKNADAEKLVNANFTCQGRGSGHGGGANVPYGCYQVLGNLHIHFQGATNSPISNYSRSLDLTDATAHVQFIRDGVLYKREVFVSALDEAIVIHLTADIPGKLTFQASLDRPERFETVATGEIGLLMHGQLNNGVNGKGTRWAAHLRIVNTGGQNITEGNTLKVTGADEAIIFVTAATDYRGFAGRQLSDPETAARKDMDLASAKPFDLLRSAHVQDYQSYYNRVQLQLASLPPKVSYEPTPARLAAAKAGTNDSSLDVLYFNFGRYLLISSSRPGGLPANLQGIWADSIQTPWNGDWHLNVNVEMNYWPAEVCNLSELHQPLFALIGSLQKPGTKTAKVYYNARGWVAHVITNPWGFTSPGEEASWGATTSGSAWLCQHLYDHYLFTLDRNFLSNAYPIMKGSAQFYADMLVEEPTHHWLVTAPANSPENSFRMANGRKASICMGPTIDNQLLRYLFDACIQSAKILGVDEDFSKELAEKLAHLPPTRIGSDGRIMEWLEEYQETDPHHRHTSHLWGLYPGSEISPDTTPDLAKAARKTLEARGDQSTGWATAFRANLWARLGDGDRADKLLQILLGNCTLPDLFDTAPPFQIDGNFGGAACIAEMLLQSQDGAIHLLPALPVAWPDGKITGLRARGDFTVDMEWKDGKLTNAVIHSDAGAPCVVKYGGKSLNLQIEKGKQASLNGDLKTL